eukprot:TCONS_00028636-protein
MAGSETGGEQEEVQVEVVVFFYQLGKTKADYAHKETAHIMIPKNIKSLAALKRTLTEQAGVRDIAKTLQWSDCEVLLSRGVKGPSGTVTFAIRTDSQLKIELPSVMFGNDRLHATVYPIEARFRSKAPVISIEVLPSSSNAVETSEIRINAGELEDKEYLIT